MCVEDAALTTDTPAIACLYEQEGADLEVSVEAVIDGVRRTLEAPLPQTIERNRIYTVTLRKGVVDTELRLTVEAWGDGGESPLQPDLAGRLTVEAEPFAAGDVAGMNRFRIRKVLAAPEVAAREVRLRFRRKGLYDEDRITLHLEANPTRMEGLMAFADGESTCDFGRYVDNELGRLTLPEGKELSVEFDAGEDPWLKIEPAEGGSREEYTLVRRNWGLPVTWFHGVWWCKYNARGRSRSFEDQILVPQDPAAAAGQSVQEYLMGCSAEEFRALWGWAYQGDSGVGMPVVERDGIPVLEGFATGSTTHINKLPADTLAPDGYELPSMEEFNRLFDATDYVWMM